MVLTFDAAAHVYRLDGVIVPSVTQVLADWSPMCRLSPALLADAAALGRDVHLATALDDRGELDPETVDPFVAPYLDAWRTFRQDTDFTPIEIEQQVYAADHRYAGTLDRYGTISWRKRRSDCLIDIKSGVADPTHGPQTAAYAYAYSRWRKRQGTSTLNCFAVYLRRDGRYEVAPMINPHRDFATFLCALAYFNWRRQYGF